MKKALIVGVSGQDGSHLASFLLKKKYKVWGSTRKLKSKSKKNIIKLGILNKIKIVELNPEKFDDVLTFLKKLKPTEIYYLSGQSSVSLSFNKPVETINSNFLGILNILEATKILGENFRIYNSGTSEMYGNSKNKINEKSIFNPLSPYALSKVISFKYTKYYRENFNIFACTGITSNHESSLRPNNFVTKKIINAVRKIYDGKQKILILGDISVVRDWGWSPEFVEAMWLMLQNDCAEDFIVSTGKSYSLEDFVVLAFNYFNLDWKKHVRIVSGNFRPNELKNSYSNPTKIRRKLGWKAKTKMPQLINKMFEDK